MAKAVDTRTESEKADHQRKIAKMYLDGKRQVDIAEALGISQSQVSRDLKKLRGQWQREARMTMKTAQGEKLAELEWVRQEAKVGWVESKTLKVISKGGEGQNWEQVTTSAGDPRFLDQVQKAIGLEMKLLGLDDMGLKLPKETLVLIEALGLDVKEVVKSLNGLLRQAVKGDVDDIDQD